jgi:hypothetical protein
MDNGGSPADGAAPQADGAGAGVPNLAALARLKPKTLREQAIEALQAGKEDEGFRLLYTHLAISPGAGPELIQNMGWLPGLRRPGLGPRIGIAVRYIEPPPDFKGSPQPIGSDELKTAMGSFKKDTGDHRIGGTRGQSSMIGRGHMQMRQAKSKAMQQAGDGSAGKGANGEGDEQLDYYTGDFGTQFLSALEQRIKAGDYGLIYKEIAKEMSRRPRRPVDPNNPQGSADNPPADPPTAPDGGPGSGHGGKPAAEQGEGQELGLAVIWIGKADNKDELNKLVKDANIDVLVTYEISLTPSKVNTFVNNKTKLRITGTKKEEMLFVSSTLENRAVSQEREKEKKTSKKGDDDDAVDREVNRAIEALDKICKVQPIPAALTAEVVKRRIESLIAEKPEDPLPALVEARFYVAKGLLPQEDFYHAAETMLGGAEYAKLVASAPGGGMGQMFGSALSLPGMLSAVRGVNAATAPFDRGAAKARGKGTAAKSGGLKSLLPFGSGSNSGGSGSPGSGGSGSGSPGAGSPGQNPQP